MTAFWILAPLMTVAALGLLFVRKAVHAALLLAFVMVSLAVLYAGLEAPFLFVVQIIVYTGAILMLFLFVVMLVGVDASDSVVETIKGQRVLAAILGGLLVVVFVLGLSQITFGAAVGLEAANEGGNVEALANLLFNRYVFAFEITAALLVTAALGAMVLAHPERIEAKLGQREQAEARMRDYAEHGKHPGPLPAPGVYARHNAVDTPGLLPDGTPAESSINRVLAARGSVRTARADEVEEVVRQLVAPGSETEVVDVPAGAGNPPARDVAPSAGEGETTTASDVSVGRSDATEPGSDTTGEGGER